MGVVVKVSLVTCAILASATAAAFAQDNNEAESVVDAVGQSSVDKDRVVGLSIGVAKGDQILCVRGFGLASVELNVPATADTVYRIGSITKEFTSAAILLLVEGGRISLDDPLTKFLPDYPAHGSAVTIRQLLHHTSGVKDFTRLPAYRKEMRNDVTPDEVLGRFQNLPLNFPPGEQYRYCNSGYFLLGLVVERASGKSFREFVEQRLFRKLGLAHTYCDANSRVIPHRAAGYSRWTGVLRNAQYISLKQTVGAGNMSSTVGDLLLWQRGLFTHRVLRTESSRTMRTRGKLSNGKSINYGLGVVVRKLDGHEAVRHGGGIPGFRADVAYYPDSELTIAVLSNTEHANTARISDRIARGLLPKSSKVRAGN